MVIQAFNPQTPPTPPMPRQCNLHDPGLAFRLLDTLSAFASLHPHPSRSSCPQALIAVIGRKFWQLNLHVSTSPLNGTRGFEEISCFPRAAGLISRRFGFLTLPPPVGFLAAHPGHTPATPPEFPGAGG